MTTTPERLEERLLSHNNAFTRLRLLLALSVSIDHAWIVSGMAGPGGADIPLRVLGLSPGWLGVNGFFFLSGLLIAKSLDQRGASLGFAISRAARIYPALVALAIGAALIVGPWVAGALGTGPYWSDARAWTYPLNVLFFGDISAGPPGFYPDSPARGVFSIPLWTLRYEVLCYIGAALAVAVGIWRWRWGVLGSLGVLLVATLVLDPLRPPSGVPGPIVHLARFGFVFTLGAAVWAWRERLSLHWGWLLGALGLAVLAGLTGVGRDAAASVSLGTIILFAGLHPASIRLLGRSDTDLSYGYYIWHYPVMQILFGSFALPGPSLLLAGTLATLPVAWASWTFVERPALGLKRWTAGPKAPARVSR